MSRRRAVKSALEWLALAGGLLVGACSADGAAGGSLSLSAVEPAAASFHESTALTLKGSGLETGIEVHFGDVAATVLSATGDSARVEVPAGGNPRRVRVRVSRGEAEAVFGRPFVFRAMAPEELRFVGGPSLPAAPDVLVAGDLDGDGRPELVGTTAEGIAAFAWRPEGPKPLATAPGGAHALAVVDVPPIGRAVVAAGDTLDVLSLKDEAFSRVAAKFGGNPIALAATAHELYAVLRSDTTYTLAHLTGPADSPAMEKLVDLGKFEVASLAVADVDADGATDLVVGGVAEGPRILLGDGHGAFRDAPAGTMPKSVAGAVRLADLDVDGAPDLVVAAKDGDRAWRNVSGRFVDRTEALFGRTDARADFEADLDGDAALDRVGGPGLGLWRNDGEGRFYDYTQKSAAAYANAHPLLAADLDGDGDLDLVVRDGQGAKVLENWAPKPWSDTDADGIDDAADNCPGKANPEQANRDRNPFACPDAACAAEPGCHLVKTDSHAYLACAGAWTFAEAQNFCRSRAAKVALGTTADEALAIGQALGTSGWIDLSDAGHEGHFTRADGSDPGFTAWRPGEPNNAGGNENCGESDAAGGWNDVPCDTRRAFACEEPLERTGDSSGDACDVCPLVGDDQKDSDGNGVGDACESAP